MLLVGNGIVVTRDENKTYIENGAICIKDQLIYDVGGLDDLKVKYHEAEFIDAKGGLIMPGFINAHNHIYSAFARGLSIPGNQPSNFLEILEGTWWKLDRKLTLKQTELSAKVTFLDCIKNGVTTVFDHHASFGHIDSSLFRIAEVTKDMGVRSCLCYEISDRDGWDKTLQAVNENIEFLEYTRRDNTELIAGMIGMHASFTLTDKTLAYIVDRNKGQGGYHIHVAEGLSDSIHCRETYGMSVVERLHKHGILGGHTIAGHCVHIQESDMDLLLDTNTSVVHNPESNMGNAVGCPEVLKMFEKGIVLGLGTDGYTNDMLESYKVGNMLHKHNSHNPSAAWNEIPTMLFEHNPGIGGKFYNKPMGVIKKGAYADIIVLDYKPFTPMNESNMNGHILFGMNGKDTMTTIINGKVLMKDREFMDLDENEIKQHALEESKRLWKELSSK